MTKSIWVSGEALIDLIPWQTQTGLKAVVGGGPANTAIALAKLGLPVKFVGGLSEDRFGKQIADEFTKHDVALDLAVWSDLPTSMAVASVDDIGAAEYLFYVKGTATFDFDSRLLPDPELDPPKVLYVGTLSAVVEPGATKLFHWAEKVAAHSVIVLDPNIRSSVVPDRGIYKNLIDRWIRIANVVKLSEDDLAFLFPGVDPIVCAKAWISFTRPLILITRGSDGLVAVTADEIVEVPAIEVTVVDSIGAGDIVGALVVEAIAKNGIDSLQGDILRAMLQRAAKAAAITCSHAGSYSPTSSELEKETV